MHSCADCVIYILIESTFIKLCLVLFSLIEGVDTLEPH